MDSLIDAPFELGPELLWCSVSATIRPSVPCACFVYPKGRLPLVSGHVVAEDLGQLAGDLPVEIGFAARGLRELVHGSRSPSRAVTEPSQRLPTLEGMKTFFLEALRSVRTDRNLQDAMFCTACWLGFASVVVASVALPA